MAIAILSSSRAALDVSAPQRQLGHRYAVGLGEHHQRVWGGEGGVVACLAQRPADGRLVERAGPGEADLGAICVARGRLECPMPAELAELSDSTAPW